MQSNKLTVPGASRCGRGTVDLSEMDQNRIRNGSEWIRNGSEWTYQKSDQKWK